MSNRNIRTRRVSARQLEVLWEFLNSHRDIATAYNRSLQAKEYSRRKWIEVSEILNAQGDGAHREWNEWSKYWVDYKAKLKKEASALRSAQNTTGGGPSKEQPMTEIDMKYMQILGNDFGQGLPGVRVEPFHDVQVEMVPQVPVESSENIILEPIQNVHLAIISEDQTTATLEESPASESILIQATTQPTTPPIRSPGVSPLRAPPTPPARTVRSPRRRRRRRDPVMTQEAARRSLVESSIQRVEATMRIGDALVGIQSTLERIESWLCGAVPRAGE